MGGGNSKNQKSLIGCVFRPLLVETLKRGAEVHCYKKECLNLLSILDVEE